MGVGARSVPFAELEEVYDGYTLFARPEFKFDSRSDEIAVSSPRGWFWGTLLASWRIYVEVVLGALLVNSFAIAGPLFVMNVYDRVVPNFAEKTLWVLAICVATSAACPRTFTCSSGRSKTT
jgi:ATP-binding cassette subfamily C protein LapB